MSGEEQRNSRLVRIELATSEIDGGSCRAWADPAQVLTAVALSRPEDTFALFVEPKLAELEGAGPLLDEPSGRTRELWDPGPGSGSELPVALRCLISKVQAIHARLHRENLAPAHEPRRVKLTCAVAEEDRVYFVKSAPAWICVLRDGRAWPAEPAAAPTPSADHGWLGLEENLGCEVTSLPVEPGDTVVLLTSETEAPLDLHAVANLFGQTADLKRACDGLVNLIGLQSHGASAVALRFSPVGLIPASRNPLDELALPQPATHGGARAADHMIEDALARTFPAAGADGRWFTEPAPSASQPPAVPSFEESGAFATLDRISAEPPPRPLERAGGMPAAPAEFTGPARSIGIPAGPAPHASPVHDAVSRPGSGHDGASGRDAAPARESGTRNEGVRAPEPPRPAGSLPFCERRDPGRRRTRILWAGVCSVVALVMIALVALPQSPLRSGALLGRMRPASGPGILEVDTNPAARRVVVDGAEVAGATPARIESIEAGRHRVELDLGPCGTWTTEVEIRPGTVSRIERSLTGSVEVTAEDADPAARAWIGGRTKLELPAVIDSLPAGWVRIFFEDSKIPLWERQVLIRPDRRTKVLIPNRTSSEWGRVRIESLHRDGSSGLVEAEGDTVRVDGRVAGRTPYESYMTPGLHELRIGPSGEGGFTAVVDAKPGEIRAVTARLGERNLPEIRHVAPGRVLVRGPVLLSVEVRQGDADAARTDAGTPMLHLPQLSSGAREVPLSLINERDRVYVAVVDPAALPTGRTVSYYFSLESPDGPVCSQLYQMTPSRHWAAAASSNGPPAGLEGSGTGSSSDPS